MSTIDTDELVANATGQKSKAKKNPKAQASSKKAKRTAIPTTAKETTTSTGPKTIEPSLKDKIGQKFLAMFFWIRTRPRLFRRWVENHHDQIKDLLLAGAIVGLLLAYIVSAGMVGWFLAGWLLGINGVGSFLLSLGFFLLMNFSRAYVSMLGEEFVEEQRRKNIPRSRTFIGYNLV